MLNYTECNTIGDSVPTIYSFQTIFHFGTSDGRYRNNRGAKLAKGNFAGSTRFLYNMVEVFDFVDTNTLRLFSYEEGGKWVWDIRDLLFDWYSDSFFALY